MYVIGLTGSSGSGKNYCCELFKNNHGIESLDTDIVARKVCSAGSLCLSELSEAFGYVILNNDGTLNRKLLASIAIPDPNKKELLNKITHKYIIEESMRWVKEKRITNEFAVIINAPLLYESRINYRCDFNMAVIADENVRLERIIKRDNLTAGEAKNRLSAQHDNQYFINRCDYLLYNNDYNFPELQIDLIVQQMKFV